MIALRKQRERVFVNQTFAQWCDVSSSSLRYNVLVEVRESLLKALSLQAGEGALCLCGPTTGSAAITKMIQARLQNAFVRNKHYISYSRFGAIMLGACLARAISTHCCNRRLSHYLVRPIPLSFRASILVVDSSMLPPKTMASMMIVISS
jgi:hypothetical protein